MGRCFGLQLVPQGDSDTVRQRVLREVSSEELLLKVTCYKLELSRVLLGSPLTSMVSFCELKEKWHSF